MKEEGKVLSCFHCENIKGVVKGVNDRRISREDLIDILYDSNQYYVLYYTK